MPSDAFRVGEMSNYSIADLQKRYNVKSPQGMGKYWQIPGEALPVIDGLRRKKPENHKLPKQLSAQSR